MTEALTSRCGKFSFINSDRNLLLTDDAKGAANANELLSVVGNNLNDFGVFSFENNMFDIDAAELLFNEFSINENVDKNEMRLLVEKSILISMINNNKINSFYDFEDLNIFGEKIFKYFNESISKEVVDKLKETKIDNISVFDKKIIENTILELAMGKSSTNDLYDALSVYSAELNINKTITTQLCNSLIKNADINTFEDVIKFIQNYSEQSNTNGSSNIKGNSSNSFGGGGGVTNRYKGQEIVKDVSSEQKPVELAVFDDLNDVEWAKESITELYKRNVLNGKNEKLFYPNDYITREEFVKILMLAFNINLINADCPFDDVNKSDWSYPYIRSAYIAKIVNGITDDYFGKELNISRQDLCVMTYRVLKTVNSEIIVNNDLSVFADSKDISDYATEAIAFMYENEIINGRQDGNYNPKSNSTRAEAAKIVYKALQVYNKIR